MTTTIGTIDVPLPAGAEPSIEDVETLRSLFAAILGLRYSREHHESRIRRALERSGWRVTCGLQWHVEVRRGRELEQACAGTLDEALTSVWQGIGAGESLEGTP